MKRIALAAMFMALGFASPALAKGWEFHADPSTSTHKLVYSGDKQVSYVFLCTPKDVVLTQFGVTGLFDFKTKKKVGDEPGSIMPPAAALMALHTINSSVPDLVPAVAVPNAVRGWDLTIHIRKSDKALRSMAKATIVSVFTTGYTAAVFTNDEDKEHIASFLEACGVRS